MKSRTYAQSVQAHLLRGAAAPLPPSARTLFVALHSENPGPSDSQATAEIPGVARAAVARTAGAWDEDSGGLANNVMISFGKAAPHDGQPRRATHWSIGTAAEGDGVAMISGKLKDPQDIVTGMVLEFSPGALRSDEF